MASECLVIASDTATIKDVIRDKVNGILLDFFDSDRLADALISACTAPDSFLDLRAAARKTIVTDYDRRRNAEPAWLGLISEVLGRERCSAPHQ
jgi:glycosyltransferase involved in cell wall biosynthesis